MKKQLLCGLAFLLFASAVQAQSPVVIYNGTTGQLFNGTPYAFDSVKVSEKIWGTNTYWNLMGTSSDSSKYVGGAGNARYGAGTDPEPLGFTGSVAGSAISFKLYTDSTSPGFRIQFVTSDDILFGYQWDSVPATADTGFIEVVVPLSDFKIIKGDTISNVALTDFELEDATSQVAFVLMASDTSTLASLGIDDLVIGNLSTLSIYDQDISSGRPAIYPNPCNTGMVNLGESPRNYSLMNSSGAAMKIGTGKTLDVSSLNPGVYYIKMDADVQKLIIN